MDSLGLGDNSGNAQHIQTIRDILFHEDLKQKLEGVIFILHSLDSETYEKVDGDNFKKYILGLLNDRDFIRQLQNNMIIKNNIEMGLEYSGRDYINTPEFYYDYEIEQKIQDIQINVNVFLGNLMRELNNTEDLEI